ncbi:hypothetical protein ACFPM0_23075 [Pseudonocardia sulfidoxydans]|uniref:hypothetical protein n=1 Tax=Pseudonocardia sulfidoxydans TaxID=54011 RepID=UPI00361C3ED2
MSEPRTRPAVPGAPTAPFGPCPDLGVAGVAEEVDRDVAGPTSCGPRPHRME